VAAGIPFSWVTADEAYGGNGPLRAFLAKEAIPYELAIARDHMVATPTGPRSADILAPPGPGTS
jgi:SRSO17 transposase